MHLPTSRRRFLKVGAATVTTGLLGFTGQVAQAAEPFKRAGKPHFRLSLAAYSFRDFFKHSNHKSEIVVDEEQKIDMTQFLDYCANRGVEGAELTSYYFPANVTDEQLLSVRRHAFLRGVSVSGTAVGNEFTTPKGSKRDQQISDVKKWIDRAVLLGAPHIRVFAGGAGSLPLEEAKKLCIEALEVCCDYAASRGIFLGIENHGGIVAEPEVLLDIIKSVNSKWLGINLDTANFHTEDPYASMALCAPYAVNVQYKTEIRAKGKSSEPADFKKVLRLLEAAGYQGFIALEYEAKEDPWKSVPRVLEEMKSAIGGRV